MVAIDDRMQEVLSIPGVSRVGLVRLSEEREVAATGPGAATPAVEVAALLRAARAGLAYAGTDIEQVVITHQEHHLLLAPIQDGDLCMQVRVERAEGHLGLVMLRLQELASTAAADPPHPRRRPPSDHASVPRAWTTVDQNILNRVLDGLRELCANGPPTSGAMAL